MRIFRKRKKYGNFHGTPEDAAPLPDIVYQMGAEAAARYVAEQEALYGFPDVPIPVEEENFIDEIPENEFGEETLVSSPLKFFASLLGIGRSKSREQHANKSKDHFIRAGSPAHFNQRPPGTPVNFHRRPASPAHFNQRPPGTPVKFHRRSASPELIQSRASSPYHFGQQQRVPSPLHFVQSERPSSPHHFAQQSRPGSPDVARRLQRAQLSQELQHIERQQRRQQDMMMINPVQFIPQYQQVQQPYYPMMNPNLHIQGYPMMEQPQMYSFY